MLSIVDKFLGSLLGAYIGGNSSFLKAGDLWDRDPINWAWQPSSQLPPAPLYSSDAELFEALPWLLWHHDNFSLRHRWLLQQLPTNVTATHDTRVARLEGLYLLGDCLEWFMQATPHIPMSAQSLRGHLYQRSATYPVHMRSSAAKFLSQLGDCRCLPNRTELLFEAGTIAELLVAIQQCIYYQESLMLALEVSSVKKTSISSILGCLLGAWAGTGVIPLHWIVATPSEVMDSVVYLAEKSYQAWAGIADNAEGLDVFPLDL
ncbi:MAG: hypothetical protein AAF959_16460 [Cyanobacteria bacterium P01_D01_bin.56]